MALDSLLPLLGATSEGGAGDALLGALLTTADPTLAAVAVPGFLELGAVVAGAVSGALVACKKNLDIIGVCVLALVTALGGGLIRDTILPTDSIYMLDTPLAVIGTTAVGVAAFFFAGLFYKLDKPIAVADIISVALFTLSGTDKALINDYGLIPCVMMGVITGVGGGVVRDICLGQIPGIFKSSNFYAVCSFAGALVYFGLVELHAVKPAAGVACIATVVGLRWLSLRYNLITVEPVDLTPKLVGPLSRIRHRQKHVSGNEDASSQMEERGQAIDGGAGATRMETQPRTESPKTAESGAASSRKHP